MSEPQKIGEVLQETVALKGLSFQQTKEELTYICSDCGVINEPFKLQWINGQERWMKRTCECVHRRYEEEEQQRKLYERQKHIEKLFNLSQLGPRFSRMTFETWQQTNGTQTAYKEAVNFAKEEKWKKGEGLLFFGDPGNGKSHLAAAIVNEIIPKGVPAIFQVVPDLLMKFKKTYNNRSTIDETAIIETLNEADLIVLDDLGAERLTDWVYEKIYEVINSLYNHEKSVIVTTNIDINTELEDRIGNRSYDRIIEMCKLIENKGTSYRRKIAENRLKGA